MNIIYMSVGALDYSPRVMLSRRSWNLVYTERSNREKFVSRSMKVLATSQLLE